MIQLTRSRKRNDIVPSFRVETQKERLIELMMDRRAKLAAREDPKVKIKSKWSVTKRQLLKETHDKCAYCESHTSAIAFGDVEHYRPKSIYWWLAYVYDNYLASCSICNQQFKSDAFEFSGPEMQGPDIQADTSDAQIGMLAAQFVPDPLDEDAIEAFEEAHRRESPLIPNPYIEPPEKIFAWEVFEGAKEVELVPNPNHPNAAEIVDACERIYGLNRPQLKRRRFNQWRNYKFFVRVAESSQSDPEVRRDANEFIEESLQPQSGYAGMVRFFESRRQGD